MIRDMRFSKSESPYKWGLKMQEMVQAWMRIPEANRGGDIVELIDQLLDKVEQVEEDYVNLLQTSSDAALSAVSYCSQPHRAASASLCRAWRSTPCRSRCHT